MYSEALRNRFKVGETGQEVGVGGCSGPGER